MNDFIQVSNLNYVYNNKLVFDNLCLNIKSNSFTTIIGPSGSGKSTLSKILVGLIKVENDIKIDNLVLNKDLNKIRKIIGYIPSNINDSLLMDTVYDEITSYSKKYSKKEFNYFVNEFKLNDLLNKNPKDLSSGEGELVYIISVLIGNPKLIIIDDALSSLDSLIKDKVLNLFKKLSKEKKITIVNFTSDPEDATYGDYIAFLGNSNIIINDKKELVLKEEKLFKSLGLKMPFMADLSIKLSYYGLIDNIELSMDKMVNKLWK